MKSKPSPIFKSKDIDLICFLRFKGFKALGSPVEDTSGTRWIIFDKTPQLEQAILSFFSGNQEAALLNEFRKTRSFILDSPAKKEIGENTNE